MGPAVIDLDAVDLDVSTLLDPRQPRSSIVEIQASYGYILTREDVQQPWAGIGSAARCPVLVLYIESLRATGKGSALTVDDALSCQAYVPGPSAKRRLWRWTLEGRSFSTV